MKHDSQQRVRADPILVPFLNLARKGANAISFARDALKAQLKADELCEQYFDFVGK